MWLRPVALLYPAWRSCLPMKCAGKSSEVAVDQIRTIITPRLTQRIDALPAENAARLRELIVEVYGLT